MYATKPGIGTLAVIALLVLAPAAGIAAADPLAKDEVYRDARLDGVTPMRVAVLPAVTAVENEPLERVVERAWCTLYRGNATLNWITADEVRGRLADLCGEKGALAADVHRMVWRDGAIDAATAKCLARLLEVDAVLTLRVDRFGIEDGCRAVTGMTAVMVGADGARLWSIRGECGVGRTRGSREMNYDEELGWIRDPRLEPCNAGGCLGRAMYNLFARWAWALPTPMYQEPGAIGPMLATQEPVTR